MVSNVIGIINTRLMEAVIVLVLGILVQLVFFLANLKVSHYNNIYGVIIITIVIKIMHIKPY